MPDILIRKTHTLTKEKLRDRLMPSIEETAKEYGLSCSWKDGVCKFTGPANGYLNLTSEFVEVVVNLGFAASFFRGRIEKSLHSVINSALEV